MEKKNKKNKLSISLSIFFIIFLLCFTSFRPLSGQALLEAKPDQNKADSYDQSTWKWNSAILLSTESTSNAREPSLVIDSADNIHVVWVDYTNWDCGMDSDIFYRRWSSSSISWSTPELISLESTGQSHSPSLAVDSADNIHVVWDDLTDYAGAGTDSDIFYKRWNSSTSSWTTTEVVSTESSSSSVNPSLAVDSADNIHIAWYDLTDYAGAGTDYDIFYRRWNSSTSVWTTTEVVSTESSSSSVNPSLAVDSADNIHIVWEDLTDYAGAGTDYDIFYKCWNSSSSSWSIIEVVSTESTSASLVPSLALDFADNIHIAWEDVTDYAGAGIDSDIFYKRWNSSISAWTTTEVVSTESTDDSQDSSLSVDSADNIHIVWEDVTDYAGAGTDHDIFYKCCDSSLSSWTNTEVISKESTEYAGRSSLAVDSTGVVYIFWDDLTDYAGAGSELDIFYNFLAGPPAPPELAFIVPNPTEFNVVNLDWYNVLWATSYHVYRSTSYIWSISELLPIITVSSSIYTDTLPSEGFYYYVVVAENMAGKSSHSNCQYIEVKFLDLKAPELAPILPNPAEINSINLEWEDIDSATEYYIYRSDTYIWSVESLTPIATVGTNYYIDTLTSEGFYFYVIVASDGARTSTHSNCEYIQYKLPSLQEFTIVSSLIASTFVVLFVVMRTRKKYSKSN